MKVRDLDTINPTKLDPKAAAVLGQYLLKNQAQKYFPKTWEGSELEIVCKNSTAGQSIAYTFKLAKSILTRKRASDPSQVRFEVLGKRISSDGNNTREVYVILGSLIPQADNTVRFKPKRRLVTKALSGYIQDLEFELHGKLYKGKKPEEIKGIYYQVMKYIHGHGLQEILKDENKPKELSLKGRLQITIRLLRALHFLHTLGYLHLDIKPENFLINPDNENISLVGFQLSKLVADDFVYLSGSLGYQSPEQNKRAKQTQASDIFSIGRLLARLWGMVLKANGDVYTSDQANSESLDANSDYDTETFEHFTKSLSESKKSIIHAAIKQMTLVNPEQRPGLIAVLECFEAGLLESMLAEENLAAADAAAVKDANICAQRVFQNLQEIAADAKHDAVKRIALYKNEILHELPNVMTNRHAYDEFFRVLDIKYLKNKAPNQVVHLLNQTESFVKNAYWQHEYQPIMARLVRLKEGLRDPDQHKKYVDQISHLTANVVAAQQCVHAPLTLLEFLKTKKKIKKKLIELGKKSFELEATLYAVNSTSIQNTVAKLGRLAGLIEANINDLKKLFKNDPSFQQKLASLAQLYQEIQADMQACQDAACVNELKKLTAAIEKRLTNYQLRYEAFTAVAKTHLAKKAHKLGSQFKFFSAHNNDRNKWLLFRVEDYISHLDWRLKHRADVISELGSIYRDGRKECQWNLMGVDRRFKPLFMLLNQTIHTQNPHLLSVCQEIKAAIENYILTTTTTFNVFFNRRAASDDRIGTMTNILREVNEPHEEKGFLLKMEGYLNAFRGNSELITSLRAIVNPELERIRNPANNLRI